MRLRRLAETLAIAVAGGALFGLAGLPAGWLSGAFLAVMAAAVAHRPVFVPGWLSRVIFVLLGVVLGGAVTPETVALMAKWPLSIALLVCTMAAITIAVAAYLRLAHGWDGLSALFAAAPGALSQALAMAAQSGADVRSVAMVQAIRILAFLAGLPLVMGRTGFTDGARMARPTLDLLGSVGELAVLVLSCGLVAALAHRYRVPGGLIVGSMTTSGLLHGSGLIASGPPSWAATACFVGLGAMIGTRFVSVDLRMLRRLALPALGALGLATLVALGFAFAVSRLLSLRFGEVFLAYVPGGLEAMSILAFALHLDPAFVGAHHLARYIFVSFALPLAAAWLMRRRK